MPDVLEAMEARLSRQIETGFSGLHSRMTRFEDEVRPLLREQGEEIAVLRDRSERATEAVKSSKRLTATRASVWGGSVGTAVLIAVEVIKAYFGGK